MENFRSRLKKFNWTILIASLILVLTGVLMIQSTIIGKEENEQFLVRDQVLHFSLALALFFLVSFINFEYLYYLGPFFFIISIALLSAVVIQGHEVRGVSRWLVFGSLGFQPSEFSKVFLLIFFSGFFTWLGKKVNTLWGIFSSFFLFGIPTFLIFLQPDLGTAMVISLSWLLLFFLSPIRGRILFFCILIMIVLAPFSWYFFEPYQRTRLLTFLNPQEDPLGAGYNVIQSIITVGSGQILGRGWGRGTQSRLQFLPEYHTDFIFATLCEELGFLGALVLLALFSAIVFSGIKIALRTENQFAALLAAGISAMFGLQITINVGMNLGLVPITGIPLPLVSYGGSSLVTSFIALGLLESIAVHAN